MTLDEAESALWEETLEDWHMAYSVGLTEPVCAMIYIHPDEGSPYPSLRGYIGKHRDDPKRDMAEAIEYHLVNIRTFKASEEGRAALDAIAAP